MPSYIVLMEGTDVKEEVILVTPNPTKRSISLKKPIFIFFAIAASMLSVWIGLIQFQMPEIVAQNASKDQFSAERAKEYLEEISVVPRPIGSAEHDRVRDYLVSTLTNLGLSPEIQIAEENLTIWGTPYEGKVKNIFARIPGEDSTGAIMITSHYDSEDNSPGAADAGSGVVAILETVRVLTESHSLKNDVIILISDGEELGLLGAQAFVQEHPWLKDIAIVLNFEARGSEGASVLFETNDKNERLVAEFAKGASNPVAHSFIYDLYKSLPNDTDLTVYKNSGLYGLNFGFFVGLYGYHTPEDTVENLSLGSLQHHGDNMLDLVRHFGNMDLIAKEDGKSLYFNVIGKKVVTYNEKFVFPIMVMAIILFFLTCFHGFIRKKTTLARTGIGLLVFILTILFAFFAGERLLTVISQVTGRDLWTIRAYPVISNPVFISIILLIFAVIITIYLFILRRLNATDLTMGALFVWLVLVCLSSLFLKSSSYVFVWPFLLGLVIFNVHMYLKNELSVKGKLLSLGMIILPFIFTVPIIYLVFVLLTLQNVGVLTAITSLLVVFIIPALNQVRV